MQPLMTHHSLVLECTRALTGLNRSGPCNQFEYRHFASCFARADAAKTAAQAAATTVAVPAAAATLRLPGRQAAYFYQ